MATPSKQRKTVKNKQTSSPVVAKKKPTIIHKVESNIIQIDQDSNTASLIDEESRDSPVSMTTTSADKCPVFKNPNFVHSSIGSAGSKKTRVWKNLKQIVAAERSLPWQPDDTTYGMIDAPPSFKPALKYSDISGLPLYINCDIWDPWNSDKISRF
ncbi:INO80 complex subunit C [Mactra antiquata]